MILSSCPDFCLTRYAADAGPPINKAIQEAADDAARLAAGHAASSDKKLRLIQLVHEFNFFVYFLRCKKFYVQVRLYSASS